MKSVCLLSLMLSLWAFSSKAQTPSPIKSCVFYFERQEHPFWKEVRKIFENKKNIVLIPEARPVDILDCIKNNNPEEILLFAHAFEVDSSATRLGFFTKVDADQARKNHKHALEEMLQFREKLLRDQDTSICMSIPDHSRECPKLLQIESQSFQALHKIKKLKPQDDMYKLLFGYNKGVFFQKPFQDLLAYVESKRQTDQSLRLKKIRLMSCEPQKIYKAYPSLESLIKNQGITLDIAPTSWFQSLINGNESTTIDKPWLRKSL